MKKTIYAVYGSGGCGRGVMPLARSIINSLGISEDRLFFIDDNPAKEFINGFKVLDFESFLNFEASERFVSIAISSSNIRKKVKAKLDNSGVNLWSIKSDDVLIMDNVQIGQGAILSPHVTLTSNITIGVCFHANLYSYVEHDCEIGDYVTFAPGVKCNGNVKIGNNAYVGSGAIIKQGTSKKPLIIGENATIGMGAVVIEDVQVGATVVGNPAKNINFKS